jgi:hypothetical protein
VVSSQGIKELAIVSCQRRSVLDNPLEKRPAATNRPIFSKHQIAPTPSLTKILLYNNLFPDNKYSLGKVKQRFVKSRPESSVVV